MKAIVADTFKTVWHKNPVSGHEWPEHIPTGKFHVSGGQSDRTFNSKERAQEWADYLNGEEKP